MSRLLDNARRFFQGLASATATATHGGPSFTVACSEGHRLSGTRTDGYQALRCPDCGEGVFVLPRSPLPEPAAPRAPTGPKRGATVEAAWEDGPRRDFVANGVVPTADDEIEWVDSGPPPRPSRGDSPEDLAAAEIAERPAGPRTAPKPRARKRTEPQPGAVVVPAAPRPTIGERLRRNRNALVFMGVVLVVAGAVAFRQWRAGLQELPHVAERGRVEGLAALDAGDFDRAYQLLSAARTAVRRLGGEFQGASAIVQGADEAEVIVRLIPSPLEEILDEAARTDPNDWVRRFASTYKGRTILVDDPVLTVPDGRGEGRYDLNYRIFPPGEGVPKTRGRIDLTGFKLLESLKPRAGDRLRFGAVLASIRMDVDTGEWLVGLEPEGGVIMTHQKALEALGWPSGDDRAAEDRP